MQNEIWKDVPGFPGYQVSNAGRVKSFRSGVRVLKQCNDGFGYPKVRFWGNGKGVTMHVHKIVALAFVPNPDGLPQINHKNEIKTDNRPDNLEWCDSKYNNNYGLRTRKASVSLSKPVKQLSRDGVLIRIFYGIHEAGRETNIDYRNIYRVLAGQRKTAGGYKWEYAL